MFSLREILREDPLFHRRRLTEWQQKGYIRKLIRGYYLFSGQPIEEGLLFEIANRLYAPSYVSLESALAYYGMIPESVYAMTSVTTRRTYRHSTPVGEFRYTSARKDLFFGYTVVNQNGRPVKMASPEKALLDYLYARPHHVSSGDIQSLRLSSRSIDKAALEKMTARFHNRRLSRQVALLLQEMTDA
jgi:predicted transcriptional regulator of viral defense system